MALPKLSRSLIRGDYEELEFTVTNPDDTVRDISGDLFVFTAKKDINQSSYFLRKSLNDGIEFTNTGSDGKAKVIIDPEDFASLTQDTTFACDIQGTVIGSSNKPYTYVFSMKVALDVSTV